MEDTGTLQSLTFLSKAGRADLNRVLVLRSCQQLRPAAARPDSAAESLAETKIGKYSAYYPALEAAYRVGHAVVDELIGALGAISGSPATRPVAVI